MRSILHAILKQFPALIPAVVPQQWDDAMQADGRIQPNISFSQEDVRGAFDRLIHNRQLYEKHRLFLVIDGLDEYEETCQEDCHDMVNLLRRFLNAAPSDVKLCVSSREYEVFQAAFCNEKGFRLQDLTHNDIKNFVQNRLDGFDVEGDTPQRVYKTELVKALVRRAEGIFLWVALALKTLRKVMKHDNQFSSLMGRIDGMPQEMESLFVHLLDSVQPFDRPLAYRTLAIMSRLRDTKISFSMSLSLLSYSFLPQYEKDTVFAMDAPFGSLPLDNPEVVSRKALARVRLNDQLNGLVEVSPTSNEIVVFSHRSVHEFISMNYSAKIAKYCDGFDIEDAICQIYLAELKLTGITSNSLGPDVQGLLCFRKNRNMDAPPYRFHRELNDSVFRAQKIDPTQEIPLSRVLRIFLQRETPESYVSVFHQAVFAEDSNYVSYQISQNPSFGSDPFQVGQILACTLYAAYNMSTSSPLPGLAPLIEGGIDLGPHWKTEFILGSGSLWTAVTDVAVLHYLRILGSRKKPHEKPLKPQSKRLYGILIEKLLESDAYRDPLRRKPIRPRKQLDIISKEGTPYVVTPSAQVELRDYMFQEGIFLNMIHFDWNPHLSLLLNFWKLENLDKIKSLLEPSSCEAPEKSASPNCTNPSDGGRSSLSGNSEEVSAAAPTREEERPTGSQDSSSPGHSFCGLRNGNAKLILLFGSIWFLLTICSAAWLWYVFGTSNALIFSS